MKKLTTLFFVFGLGISAWAYDFKSGDLYYNITSSIEPYTVEVTYELVESAYTKDNYEGLVNVEIPEYVIYNSKQYKVTSIGYGAFQKASSIKTIKIPNSISSLGYKALYTANSLETITLPANISKIPVQSSGEILPCIKADTIVFLSDTPPVVEYYSSKYGISGAPICIVPCHALENYSKDEYFRSKTTLIERDLYSINITTNNTLLGNACQISKIDCSIFVISAFPNEGCTFVKWSDGNMKATRYIELTQDTTLTAYFSKEEYTIHVYQDCNTTIE